MLTLRRKCARLTSNKLKITMIAHAFLPTIGGVQIHVYQLAKHLLQTGNAIEVLTQRIVNRYILGSNELIKGIKVTRFLCFYDLYQKLSLNSSNLDVLHFHGPVPSPLLNFFPFPLRVSTAILKLRQALVHLNRLKKKINKPLVVTFHGLWKDYMPQMSFLDHETIETSDAIIAVDKGIADSLKEMAIPNVFYIPNGVDTSFFRPSPAYTSLKQTLQVPQDSLIILCPRRMDPKCGIEYLIDAFSFVKKEVKKAKLVLLSPRYDRQYEQVILQKVKNHMFKNDILFIPGVPNHLMPLYYSIADVCAFPSVWEATSIAALEAMACCKPIVAFATGGLKDLVANNINGFLVEPKDSKSLAERIIAILTDRKLKRKLGNAARKAVADNFDWKVIGEKTMRVYLSLLDGN